ncbi:ferritin-like domain-containing protein [Flavihumibacter sp. CACIAM 22H1]|uniref:YciE/YciF ferroxidase family protein n=1 Tax=Flavihumibacter sp. CACIAM 22H1 TaxID=1812911 RepID=UPI0007A7F4CA|nr:ferritin-like domain-containing protein [Flavihumibacter sp. CACIAM 22H1]KYP14131.1 MAG: rubrerythrin family protein [Flavihumibacter sp. CACIAM 22H1]
MSKTTTSARSGKQASAKQGSTMENTQLGTFFMDAVKDLYWAEKHLVKVLPKMQEAATTVQLKSTIEEHLVQTEEHVTRLEKVFELLGEKAQAKKCEAMEGLVKEGETVIEETTDGSITRDVGIIASAQKVEHYEISAYGTLAQLALTLGQEEVADLLKMILEEEKLADQNLTEIAENNINYEAEKEEA